MPAQIVDAKFVKSHIGKMPIVDVRPPEIFAEGHIPTAINICVAEFDMYGADEANQLSRTYRRHALSEDVPMIIYCQIGRHAKQACDLLESEGYENLYLYLGSYKDWVSDPTNPVEQ